MAEYSLLIPVDPVEFKVDRPFLYSIVKSNENQEAGGFNTITLFTGNVVELSA